MFQAQQQIFLVVNMGPYMNHLPPVVVRLEIYVSKRKLVCKTRWSFRCLIFTRCQFWHSGTVVACVCPSVRPSVRPFFRAITHYSFKPGSPNLDHRCKKPWLRSLLFWGWLTLTFKVKFNFKIKFTPVSACEFVRAISHRGSSGQDFQISTKNAY